jgi:CRISPR system Cascade subunit CasE
VSDASLHLVEIRTDLPRLMAFARMRGVPHFAEDDLGYTVHLWLIAAFGGLAPRPWRIWTSRRHPTRILGYASTDAAALRAHIREFADPSAFAVVRRPEESIQSRIMPKWQTGRRLGFEIQCCPIGRSAATGVEKDIFLVQADQQPTNPLSRESVYLDWAKEQLEQEHATTVEYLELRGFRLVHLVRLTHSRSDEQSGRRPHILTRPQIRLSGELTVNDPGAFSRLLHKGVGRHRAFGYGMLLLRPPV